LSHAAKTTEGGVGGLSGLGSTHDTVVGFSDNSDKIGSVTSAEHLVGTSTNVADPNGGTLVTFNDGTTMLLPGIHDISAIKFIQ
jgi:hypothetical protein